jgi:hypothetical protein
MMAAAAHNAARSGEVRPAPSSGRVRLRLWLPLTPLFWLLSPFALLFAPFVWLGTPRRTRNPWVWAIAIGRVLVSLGGVVVDIDAPGARLFIRVF